MRHGSNWSYCRHGCRCDLCTAAHRDVRRDERRQHPTRRAPVDRPLGTSRWETNRVQLVAFLRSEGVIA